MAQCGPQFNYSSDAGRFMVNEIKGCAGLTVEICITDPAINCSSCSFDFGDGSNDVFTHTYTSTGTFRITVIFPNPIPPDFIDIEITDKQAPNFSLYSCAGGNVKVDILDTQYDNYQIDFGDGTQQTITQGAPDPEHSYANNSPRTVTVKGIDNNAFDNCPVATDSFTPINTIPPAAITSLSVINDSQLELRYNLSPDILYRLEIQPNGVGNFSFLKQISQATLIDTASNLNLANTYYCFRVASVDPCTNNTVYSNTICSINLSLTVQDGFNNISWSTNNPASNFSLVRSLVTDNSRTTLDPYQTIGNTLRTYDDSDLQCNTNYCYSIYATYGGGVSMSSEQCGVSIRTAATESIDDLSLIVDDNNIVLEWPLPNTDVSEYVIRRDNVKVGSSQTTTYTDEGVNVQGQSYCYSIDILDQCNNVNNLGVNACSIYLEGAFDNNNVVSLSWNDYSGFQNGVANYTVEKFYQGASAGSQSSSVTNFSEAENNPAEQAIGYRVTAIPVNSTLPPAVSNLLILAKPNNIYYPTAFTPDGNGNNDVFFVKGQFIVSYSLQIFNRWGQMIFTSDNIENGWDGTINGKPQPEGTYIFNVDITDLAGREFKKNGSFLLLRK
ncbi:MAG TPA: gliding motility-associated C-terminal domain-containing protein [Fulvivirga sp.]|nr:gliding motility-associated C-terminal domain-containing protein [Fulvivirga sp.]